MTARRYRFNLSRRISPTELPILQLEIP
ncbi:hypothetical protein MY3296_007851 [Beauveria thailandica]